MYNRENIDKISSLENIFSRVGGTAIRAVDSMFNPPVVGEPPEGFKKFVGVSVLSAGAVATVIALDKITGLGTNPLNYAVPIELIVSQ